MTALETIIYGLVQGLTEFLPVSSSGHLALYAALIEKPGTQSLPLAVSVLVHLASLAAIVIVFRRELVRLFFEDRRLGIAICIATVPAAALGLGLHSFFEQVSNQPTTVALCLMVTGLALIAGEFLARSRRNQKIIERDMAGTQVFAVGIAQAVALLPGVSRSGMTISTGRSLGLDREASVRFAFLLGVPAIAGAACLEGLKLWKAGTGLGLAPLPAALGFAAALVSSWFALRLLLRIVRRVGLWVFSPYCFAVAAAALAYFPWR